MRKLKSQESIFFLCWLGRDWRVIFHLCTYCTSLRTMSREARNRPGESRVHNRYIIGQEHKGKYCSSAKGWSNRCEDYVKFRLFHALRVDHSSHTTQPSTSTSLRQRHYSSAYYREIPKRRQNHSSSAGAPRASSEHVYAFRYSRRYQGTVASDGGMYVGRFVFVVTANKRCTGLRQAVCCVEKFTILRRTDLHATMDYCGVVGQHNRPRCRG